MPDTTVIIKKMAAGWSMSAGPDNSRLVPMSFLTCVHRKALDFVACELFFLLFN
jgi:hypothetical protein